jgi:3-oxoacyl-[acyl-carrier-protein] synthase-3
MGAVIESVGVAGARGLRRASSVELAARAARRAIEAAGCEASEIGLLVSVGVYRDQNICEPAIAPFVQRRIGLNA